MKTPRFLLSVTLLFWGWQADFLVLGMVLALLLELSQFQKVRWELTDTDFSRIWTFCTLLFLGAAVYAFTANQGPAELLGFFENPNFFTQRNAGNSTARTAASLIRWQPLIFFPFILAQRVSTQQAVPAYTISLILRRRWKMARQQGVTPLPYGNIDVSYPYFILCLFATSVQTTERAILFSGTSLLVAWALWPFRSPRYGFSLWALALVMALGLGYVGQRGIGQFRHWLEEYNPAWLARSFGGGADPMRSKTALGSIGHLKGSTQIEIRLEPKSGGPPALLREASYGTYKSQVWLAGIKSDIDETLTSSPTNQTTFVLLPDKTNAASRVNIACYLQHGRGSIRRGLLPVPEGTARLENLAAFTLQKNLFGDLMAKGPGILIFDACYGPGGTIDSPPETNEDLSVPVRENAAVSQIASQLQLDRRNQEEALRTISAFFRANFSYRSWQDRDQLTRTNETPLGRFLLRRHSGHCEYFATATVLLCRKAGIPARYAVGYAVHELAGEKYVVRQRDAHAWAIVWNASKQIWQDFDTTPASWVEAETSHSPFQSLADAWSGFTFELSKFRWGQTHLRQYLLWALAPVLLLLLIQILWRLSQQRRRALKPSTTEGSSGPGLDSELYSLERALSKYGVARETGEPLSLWFQRTLRHPRLAGMQQPSRQLLSLHYRYRFDPCGLDTAQRALLSQKAHECLVYLRSLNPNQ